MWSGVDVGVIARLCVPGVRILGMLKGSWAYRSGSSRCSFSFPRCKTGTQNLNLWACLPTVSPPENYGQILTVPAPHSVASVA